VFKSGAALFSTGIERRWYEEKSKALRDAPYLRFNLYPIFIFYGGRTQCVK
jgi:hypothetical protein